MRKLGIKIPEKAVTDGLSLVKWGARFEFVTDNIIIDGAHNIDGIRALKHSLLSLNRDIILITAMMEDKDYNSCIREIAPIAKAVIATELDIPRCVKAEKIAAIISSINISVTVNTNPEQALYNALHAAESGTYGKNTVICVCGSLFLAGETRKFFS